MFLTISILLYKRADITREFLTVLGQNIRGRNDAEVIIRNNGSNDNGESEDAVFKSGIPNLVYISSNNLGFGPGHNKNLSLARGKYFLVLNNDLFIKDPGWLRKAIDPLESDPDIMIVGLDKTPCSFRDDATGFIGGKKEYAEGSFLMVRTEDFRKDGLFSEVFNMFFCEDADLSLRVRQMGKKIIWAPIKHTHMRSQSINTVDNHLRGTIQNANLEKLRNRWRNYFVTKQFSNRILVKIESLGIGDVVANTPLLQALRRDHPTAVIEVTTTCPDVFIGNPYLSELYNVKRSYSKAYDRIIDTKPVGSLYKPLIIQSEEIAITKIDSYLPQLFLSKGEWERGQSIVNSVRQDAETVVGVSLQMERTTWQGRNYPLESAKVLVRKIKDTGAKVIEFGKGIQSTGEADLDLIDKISLRDFFSITANLDMAVCLDSLMFHVVQAFSIPTFVLWGATEPVARVVDWKNIFPITAEISCRACYNIRGPTVPDWNKCSLGNESCMDISPDDVIEKMHMSKEQLLCDNIKYLESWVRKLQK